MALIVSISHIERHTDELFINRLQIFLIFQKEIGFIYVYDACISKVMDLNFFMLYVMQSINFSFL